MIDFNQTLGTFIDREENRDCNVKPYKPFMSKKVENFQIFMPEIRLGSILELNMQMTIKIRTNLKLQIIDKNGNKLI